MRNLLYKELKLATPLLTFLFIGFTVMTFIPGYPILCGTFFICLGMFQGYQYCRESGGIIYSVILPVKKTDVVKAKYIAAAVLQIIAFGLCTVFSLVRMIFMSDAPVYLTNVMMAANPVYLGFMLLIFALFNCVFIGGFFRTAYNLGKPFVTFIIVCFGVIIIAEALHHFPGLEWLNTLGFEDLGSQLMVMAAGAAIYICITIISCRNSQRRFEKIDM